MRIALVTYDDTPPQGGQGVVVRDLRRGLQATGVDVVTLSGRGDHAIAFPRVLHRAPLDFSLRLNRHPELIARMQPDVVHLQGGPGGVLLTRRLARPMVVTAHHTYRQAYSLRSLRRALARIEARCYRRASRILAVSESTASAILSMGVPASRIEVLPPGVSIPMAIDPAKRIVGRVLFVGRLEAEKGVVEAIHLMLRLAADRPGMSGHIVGRGRLERQVVTACSSVSGIEFLGGVDDTRLAEEYAAAEVVVMPSRYEGLGLVALEAMAAGAVVCGYDVVGLRDAALGVAPLAPAGDLDGLRANVTSILDDPAWRAELAALGRDAVIEHHSWERHVTRLLEIYAEVTAA